MHKDYHASDGDSQYVMAVCGPVSSPLVCVRNQSNSSACQIDTVNGSWFNVGTWLYNETAQWQFGDPNVGPGSGIMYPLIGDRTCPYAEGDELQPWTANIILMCASDQGDLIVENQGCTQNYTLPSDDTTSRRESSSSAPLFIALTPCCVSHPFALALVHRSVLCAS
jgi:hypothetical protein